MIRYGIRLIWRYRYASLGTLFIIYTVNVTYFNTGLDKRKTKYNEKGSVFVSMFNNFVLRALFWRSYFEEVEIE